MSSHEAKDARLPHTRITGAPAPSSNIFSETGALPVATMSGSASELPTLATPPAGNNTLPELRPPLVPGDLGAFGGYRVVRLLGRGGMGAVYEAIDPVLNRRVALKLMLPTLAASEEGRVRFLREARAAAAVHHENVVSVYAVGEDQGVPFLTMELLRGTHLGNLLKRDLPVAEVLRIGREVARGLAPAHALGVIHRDIKPANVWIEESTGRVRLLDFGLARLGGEASTVVRGGASAAPELTQAGAMIGTLLYMAPEQVNGETVDARTDLFALGVVLYQMLSGQVPFSGLSLSDIAAAILRGKFPPLNEFDPTLPPDLAHLVHSLLAPNPAHRPQRALEVADELLAIGTQLLISTGSTAVVIPVPASAPRAEPTFDFDPETPPVPRRRIDSPAMLLLGTAAALVAVLLITSLGLRLAARRPAPKPPAELAGTKLVPVAPPVPAQPQFVSLFNGRDLTGWGPAPGCQTDAWTARDGVLSAAPTYGADHVLFSATDYADFELKLEYRWTKPGGHTVLLLRAAGDTRSISSGLALNLGDDEGFPAVHRRDIGEYYRTGTIQGITAKPAAANQTIGKWNELHVTVKGPSIALTLNRIPMPPADLSAGPLPQGSPESIHTAGPIGLVCHWGPIEFRNISIKVLAEGPKK